MEVYGPVPSRRLGKSLGINNIPYKVCSYSCIYCQVGKAVKMNIKRQEFHKPDDIVKEVKNKLKNIKHRNKLPDYLSIVPDGEPTLDINLGELIQKLKKLEFPVAVISNSSLIQFPDVQKDLFNADYVSLKIDTVNPQIWKKLNKPYKELNLENILDGISLFTKKFNGCFVTETMMVKGINDSTEEAIKTARFISNINPKIAYIAIPVRPPAYAQVKPANHENIINNYTNFKEYIENVELLTGYEGNAFSSTGNLEKDILSISAVHPLREDAINELQKQTNDNNEVLNKLINENLIKQVKYRGHNYYIRKFK